MIIHRKDHCQELRDFEPDISSLKMADRNQFLNPSTTR